jgi:tetratricopeptide (TPR) repeat protein/regulation of enolase protein 1 (concanavalin A-like superfamily)
LPVLARLVPPGLDVAAALDRLDERDFVYLERSWPEAEYSFKHVLTQEAIYGTLLVGRKTQLHRQAGAAMEARYADSLAEHYEALAQHYDRSDAGEKAVEYLLKAGEKARRAYLNDEAIGYFERALARCEQVAPVAGQGEGCASARLEALTGLGKVHFLVGRFVEAEGWLRKAISLGREIGVTPKELARLYFWVGDALYWQGRFREMAQLGEEGLALLGGEIESVEAVPLSYFIVIELRLTGEEERFWEGLSRIAEYIGRLPYCEELRSVHIGVAVLHALWRKDIKGGERWLDMIEGFSKRYHDDRALCEVLVQRSVFQFRTGDIQAALLTDAQALAKCLQIGDTPSGVAAYELLCAHHLALGRLAEAEIWARRSLEDPIAANDPGRAPWAPITQSIVRVCDGDDPGALVSAQEISELLPRLNSYRRFLASTLLAGIYLALGQRAEARALYAALFRDVRPALVCGWSRRGSLRPLLPALLVGLEAVYEDPLAFRAFCRDYRAQHPEVATLSLRQWYGEPAAAGPIPSAPRFNCEFACETVESLLAVGWRWHDPCGDGAFGLQQGAGLALCAANGRDLFYINQTAPRWVRPAGGDFVAEVVCLAVDDRPAMGGLLVWRDRENYLLVEWGRYGRRETLFAGCVANVDMDYGRGCLSGQPAKVYLRLARRGGRVDALCSADGETWWSVGHAAFPADDPVQIGVCAIGMIDRTIYPGAYREGTAIRFEVLRVW